MQVYVSKGGQQYGPYTVEQLRQYVEVGNFAPTDHACCDGANWVTIAQVPGFAPAVGKTVPKQVEKPAEKPRGKLYLIIGVAVLLIVASSVSNRPSQPSTRDSSPAVNWWVGGWAVNRDRAGQHETSGWYFVQVYTIVI